MASGFTPPPLSSHQGPAPQFTPPPLSLPQGSSAPPVTPSHPGYFEELGRQTGLTTLPSQFAAHPLDTLANLVGGAFSLLNPGFEPGPMLGEMTGPNPAVGAMRENLTRSPESRAAALTLGGLAAVPGVMRMISPEALSTGGFMRGAGTTARALPKAGAAPATTAYPPLPGIVKFGIGKIPYIGKPALLGYEYLRSKQPVAAGGEPIPEPIPMGLGGTLPGGLSYRGSRIEPGVTSKVPGPSVSPLAPVVPSAPQSLAPIGTTGERVMLPASLPQAGVSPLAPFGGATGDVAYPAPVPTAAAPTPLAGFGTTGSRYGVNTPITPAGPPPAAPIGSTGELVTPPPTPAAAPTPQAATFGTTGTAGGLVHDLTSGTPLGTLNVTAGTPIKETPVPIDDARALGRTFNGVHKILEDKAFEGSPAGTRNHQWYSDLAKRAGLSSSKDFNVAQNETIQGLLMQVPENGPLPTDDQIFSQPAFRNIKRK